MPRTPLAARSISKRLYMRKMTIFGKTQREIACVRISALMILRIYSVRLWFPVEKRNTMRPTKSGNRKPETAPTEILSYFSVLVMIRTVP
jgi:hypothetical protein